MKTFDFRGVSQGQSETAEEGAESATLETGQQATLTSHANTCCLCGHPSLATVNKHIFCEECAIGYLLNLKAAKSARPVLDGGSIALPGPSPAGRSEAEAEDFFNPEDLH